MGNDDKMKRVGVGDQTTKEDSVLTLGLGRDEGAHTAPTVAKWATGCSHAMGCVGIQQPTEEGNPRAQAHSTIDQQQTM